MLLTIETEKNEHVPFKADHKVLEGLYLTTDSSSVQENLDALKIVIQFKEGNQQEAIITKHRFYSVVTLVKSSGNFMQYLVHGKLEDSKVDGLSHQEITPETKELIHRAKRMVVDGML
ncbi:MAG: hypothetical protein WBA16_03675 [Nonlabens sp.]